MKYVIRGEKIEVTDSIRKYVEQKLSKIDRYLSNPENTEAKVIIKIKGVEQKVEVTIPNEDFFIRAEESHSDLYAAIDLVLDKLERQCRKYKDKLITRNRQFKKNEEDYEDTYEEEDEIVKRKKVYLKPMDEKEAIMQMELLGHTFFIFKNIANEKVCVVYKRLDESYGIIETN